MRKHNKTNSMTNDELKITNETVIRNSKFVIDKGYKQTKIGIIPNDWEVKRLEEIGTFFKGKGISKSELKESGLNAVRYGEIYTTHNYFIKEFQSFISQETANNSFKLKNGDLLFAGSGETIEDIGKSVAFVEEKEAYAGGDIVVLRPNKGQHNSLFLGFVTNHDLFNKQTYRLGQGNSVVHIYSSGLKNTQLPIPPLPEQKAIADCLTTWDKGIEKLTALINAKKTQKKALMQSIFNDELRIKNWKEVKLGEVAKYRRGSFPQPYGLEKWYDDKNGFPFVQVYDVDKNFKLKSNTKRKISQLATEQSVFIKKGTIIITLQGSIGRVAITQYDAFVDRTLLLFEKFNQPTNKIFFIHILHRLFEREKQKAPGGTIKTITKEVLSNFSITFPPLAEQKEIANLLSTADKEIELLEQKLVALQRQKQGLMQVLLTGQLRIKNYE